MKIVQETILMLRAVLILENAKKVMEAYEIECQIFSMFALMTVDEMAFYRLLASRYTLPEIYLPTMYITPIN